MDYMGYEMIAYITYWRHEYVDELDNLFVWYSSFSSALNWEKTEIRMAQVFGSFVLLYSIFNMCIFLIQIKWLFFSMSEIHY